MIISVIDWFTQKKHNIIKKGRTVAIGITV